MQYCVCVLIYVALFPFETNACEHKLVSKTIQVLDIVFVGCLVGCGHLWSFHPEDDGLGGRTGELCVAK